MKRYALLFSLLAFCFVSVVAGPVSRSQALGEAKSFLSSKGIALGDVEVACQQPRRGKSLDASAYYVFNVGEDQGFVIVSGDDRVAPILGYTDSGHFDETDVPDFLRSWLEGYAREVESMEGYAPTGKRRAMERTKRAIVPMTTTRWGHGHPYNSKTPVVDGKQSPVGCSPSIFAQLLYYYREKVGNSIPVTVPAYTSNDMTLSAIPAGTLLDWDNMLDQYTYNSGYTTAQADAVANLMLYSGKAMSSLYYSNTTLTTTRNFVSGLVDYFGFDNSIAYIDREYYSDEEWEDAIYNELANGRPVSYFSFSQNAGHNLLVDGYDGYGLYHINWGWGGKYDGYFRLSVLNRYQAGYDTKVDTNTYAIDHSALLYVSPASDGSVNTSGKRLSAKVMSVTNTSINCQYINQSGLGGSYYYGLGCMDDEGNMTFLKEFNIRHTPASLGNRSVTSRTFGVSAADFENQGFDYGTYKVVPIYQLNGEDEWKKCQFQPASYVAVEYSATGIEASYHTHTGLTVAEFEQYGNGLKDSEQVVRATIANMNSEEGFFGDVYLFASTTATIGSYQSYAHTNLGKGDAVTVDLSFTPTETGTYTLWVASDESCTNVIGKTTVNIGSSAITEVKITKGNANYSIQRNYAGKINGVASIYGNTLALNFTNIVNPNNFPVTMSFNVWLREWDSMSATSWNYNPRFTTYGDNGVYDVVDVMIPANDTIVIPLEFKGLKYGTKYDVRLEERGKTSTNYLTTQALTFLPAVISWYDDGKDIAVAPSGEVTIDDNAIAVDITDADGISNITPNGNPNVLYYMGETQAVPSGLENSNVVKGKQAEKVVLKDGYSFYVPKTFTAKEISYTTIPTKGAVKGTSLGWNTISLPFDVTGVRNTTDDVEIDWFHSDDDMGKSFWVRGFERLDASENAVIFDNVDKMNAYEPYIFNVPSSYWGKKWDLRNKEITFMGENALLHQYAYSGVSSSHLTFIGTTCNKAVANAYVLNEDGDYFIYGTNTRNVPAFHGYFVFSDDLSHSTSGHDKQPLRIKCADDDMTDAVMMPYAADDDVVDIYNLQGVKVATGKLHQGLLDIQTLPNGIYIVNGKKMIVSK